MALIDIVVRNLNITLLRNCRVMLGGYENILLCPFLVSHRVSRLSFLLIRRATP